MEKKSKRDRGRIITTSGLKKLNEAIEAVSYTHLRAHET